MRIHQGHELGKMADAGSPNGVEDPLGPDVGVEAWQTAVLDMWIPLQEIIAFRAWMEKMEWRYA